MYDTDGDGCNDLVDVSGTCGNECIGDYNSDGTINTNDLLQFLQYFGTVCTP